LPENRLARPARAAPVYALMKVEPDFDVRLRSTFSHGSESSRAKVFNSTSLFDLTVCLKRLFGYLAHAI
jgi:hypothetical protein